MSYVKCSGAIEECLQCTHSDCIHDTRLNKATRNGKLVKVDDYIDGDRIFERSDARQRELESERQHALYAARKEKKNALLSGN